MRLKRRCDQYFELSVFSLPIIAGVRIGSAWIITLTFLMINSAIIKNSSPIDHYTSAINMFVVFNRVAYLLSVHSTQCLLHCLYLLFLLIYIAEDIYIYTYIYIYIYIYINGGSVLTCSSMSYNSVGGTPNTQQSQPKAHHVQKKKET